MTKRQKKPQNTIEIDTEWVDVAKLKPWAKNPRVTEDLSDIMASLKAFGWAKPLLARRANGEIIAGHRTLRAAVKLGMTEALVRYLDLDEEQAHLLSLADNKTNENGKYDDGALDAVLADLLERGHADTLADLGFDLSQPEPSEVKEIDVSDVQDEFWISVRGPLPAQPEALHRLRAALEEIEGVFVELGTTAP